MPKSANFEYFFCYKIQSAYDRGCDFFLKLCWKRIVWKGSCPSLESWIQQQRLLENEAVGRWREIYSDGREYKTKNKRSARLDQILISYRKQHKDGNISDNGYFDQCVLAIQKA